MPVKGFACPSTAPTYGEVHTPEFCILKCKNRCHSPFLLAALTQAEQESHHVGQYVSVTGLSGCARKLKLERTVDYVDEPKNLLYAFRGSLAHTVVETAARVKLFNGKSLEDLGYVSEWSMFIGWCLVHRGFRLPSVVEARRPETWKKAKGCPYCRRNGMPDEEHTWLLLGGTLDGLEPLWDLFDKERGVLPVVLHDLKTMKDYALKKFIQGDSEATLHPNVKDDYVAQAQCYRYLGEKARPPKSLRDRGVRKLIFTESRIQALAMGDFPYTGAKYRLKSGRQQKEYMIPAISFFEDKWVEKYIHARIWEIYKTLILDEGPGRVIAPAENAAGAHHWLCGGFCPFHGSSHCPDPGAEWRLMQRGYNEQEAFDEVSRDLNKKAA